MLDLRAQLNLCKEASQLLTDWLLLPPRLTWTLLAYHLVLVPLLYVVYYWVKTLQLASKLRYSEILNNNFFFKETVTRNFFMES